MHLWMIVPETESVQEDPFSLDPKSRMVSAIPLDPKKAKTSCTLVFKVPKKKEIDGNDIHPGMEGKDEPINKSNNSGLLVGTKNSVRRSGPERAHDELGDKRISINVRPLCDFFSVIMSVRIFPLNGGLVRVESRHVACATGLYQPF